ncbi:MAG: histidine phosphatase family protein [Burkholderiaceae bacterium]|nr:histidine phosphatase family protein [Burkholderiaceae bacterium]
MADALLRAWRHPRPEGATGRCIGAGTDLPVHWRRAKRLARRIQQQARRERLAHCVHTSPLRRCADVGRWLRRWGWRHVRDHALLELDFGAWDGQPWISIAKAEVDAWVAEFASHHPGGGESLLQLLQRAAAWSPAQAATRDVIVVTHGGWMLARRWGMAQAVPSAATWPGPPAYGALWSMPA